VYGGVAKYSSSGSVQWVDDLQPALDTANQVLFYGNHAIFSQFSASNGGWTVDGGQPYLVAKADPYDTSASGDPYANYSQHVANSSIARYYGLSKVTKMEITKRDGHGTGGGRVTAAKVWGYRSGKAVSVTTTGFDLASALGAGTTWITIHG
jgi:peptidoglycan hydrolase-like amidase